MLDRIHAAARRSLPLAAAVLGLAAAGCASYTIKPEPLKEPPLASETPLPLRVGVLEKPEDFKGWRKPWLRPADARRMTDALRYSGLFRRVAVADSPNSDDFDVVVSWALDVKYSVGIFPFLPLCDPLILGCFLDNTDTMSANVQVTASDGTGRQLRQYNADQQGTLIYQIGALGKREVARNSTVDHAIAAVVRSLIADRAFFATLVKARKAPAQTVVAEDKPAADETAAPTPAAATVSGGIAAAIVGAAATPASAAVVDAPSAAAPVGAPAATEASAPAADAAESAAEPARPKGRRSLTPAEQREIEEELLP